jgi:uncharacterized protein
MAIGTVVSAEFFLTLTISAAFLVALGAATLSAPTLGLLLGGLAAVPLGAWVARRLPPRSLLLFIGVVLTANSLYGVYTALR